ncbi:hypothetical protein V2W45_1471696 [Cenococcum geophilum]
MIRLSQYLERKEEGKLLHKILKKGVVNVARYYYYKTIRVSRQDNDIFNIHKGLDITKAINYKLEGLIMPLRLAKVSSKKRSSSYSALLPPGKRLYSTSLTKRPIIQNRLAFLIDFNLTIKEQRKGPLEARGKTSTKAQDILSLICIYYNKLGKDIRLIEFKKLVGLKKSIINNEGDFLKSIDNNFLPYYQPLIP